MLTRREGAVAFWSAGVLKHLEDEMVGYTGRVLGGPQEQKKEAAANAEESERWLLWIFQKSKRYFQV